MGAEASDAETMGAEAREAEAREAGANEKARAEREAEVMGAEAMKEVDAALAMVNQPDTIMAEMEMDLSAGSLNLSTMKPRKKTLFKKRRNHLKQDNHFFQRLAVIIVQI